MNDIQKREYIKDLIKKDLTYMKIKKVDVYVMWFAGYYGFNYDEIKDMVYEIFTEIYEENKNK